MLHFFSEGGLVVAEFALELNLQQNFNVFRGEGTKVHEVLFLNLFTVPNFHVEKSP